MISKRRASSPSLFSKIKKILIKAVVYFLIASIGSVLIFKFLPIPFTMTMINQKFNQLIDDKGLSFKYSWKSMDNISREAALAVVASEDQLFPDHFGFDFASIQNNFIRNQKAKKIRGGSTLSNQVAKNVFLWQKRSYFRKALEYYFTVLIELIWGKERILEVYLNVAETGKYTFGFEAASQRYFNKPAKNLTRQEAAKITAVLPSPRKWSVANPGPYVNKRTAHIVRQMRAIGGTNYISNLRKF